MKKNTNTRNYFTTAELASAALERAKQDPAWASITSNTPLDYLFYADEYSRNFGTITSCYYNSIGHAEFGGCEGVYADVDLVDKDSKIHLFTLKTLDQDKTAFLDMQHLAGLLAYYVSEIMCENLDRFD